MNTADLFENCINSACAALKALLPKENSMKIVKLKILIAALECQNQVKGVLASLAC